MSPPSARPSLQAARAQPLDERVRSSRDFEERMEETAKGGQRKAPLGSSFAPVIMSCAKAASDDQTTSGPAGMKTLVTLRTAEEVKGCTTRPSSPHCRSPAGLNFCPEICGSVCAKDWSKTRLHVLSNKRSRTSHSRTCCAATLARPQCARGPVRFTRSRCGFFIR